jgi:hypothetical protein
MAIKQNNNITPQFDFGTTKIRKMFYGSNLVYDPSIPADPDVQAFINATGISGTEATAINTLVLQLKDDGVWPLIDAAYPFVGGTAASCKYNLVNPVDTNAAYRMTFNGSWTINSSGVIPTTRSDSNFGNSFWSPNGARNNAHHYYRYINSIEGTECDYAGLGPSPYLIMGLCPQCEWFSGGAVQTFGGAVSGTAGFSQAISRETSTLARFYRKLEGGTWTLVTSNTNAVGTISTGTMYIGAINGESNPEILRYGFLSYGNALTETQIAAYDAAVTTFNTTLGRNF